MTKRLLARFAEQTELSKVYKKYLFAYETTHPLRTCWPEFNDFQIMKTVDNVGVYYTPETTLFAHDEKTQKQDSVLAKNIGARLVDSAAYFLAQNIPVEDVPEKLRLCLAVCHNNIHWTGVIATVDFFKKAYETLYSAWMSEALSYREGANDDTSDAMTTKECIRHNQARNTIFKFLGIDPKANEDDITQRTLRFFQKGKPLLVEHYDSINSAYYTRRIEHSLHKIRSISLLKSHYCSQQKGNTCGDHTTVNLFVAGVMNTLPVINNPQSTITSAHLRRITDDQTNDISDAARILNAVAYPHASNPEPTDVIKTCNDFVNTVYDAIHALHALDRETTTRIVHHAIAKASLHTTTFEDEQVPLLSEKQQPIFDELTRLFSEGIHGDNDPIPYCALAILVAKDYCAEIESQRLRQRQEDIKRIEPSSDDVAERLNQILSELAGKVDRKQLPEPVTQLLTQLKEAKDNYLRQIRKHHENKEKANQDFTNQCKTLITDAISKLKDNRDWSVYLANVLKKIVNAVIKIASLGRIHNFFKYQPKPSESVVTAVEETKDRLLSAIVPYPA